MTQQHDYSDYVEKPGDNLLAVISAKAKEYREAELEVERLTDELKKAQAKFLNIAEFELPKLMDEARQEECSTQDGLKVKVTEKIRGSIPKATQDEAFKWLEDNEHGDLIKRQVIIQFNRDEEGWANKFLADLAKRKKKVNSRVEKSVHPSTLASFVKEQLEEGENIPLATLGVYRQRVAKVDLKTDKKSRKARGDADEPDF